MNNYKSFQNIFKNKRILITGHTGFKGSWLTQILLLFDAQIMGISLPGETSLLFKILNVKKKITHKKFDLSKNLNFQKFVIQFDPHYLFHLAAQSLVISSVKDPYYTFRNNINSSLNILECAKKISSLKSLIFVSSDKCYDVNNKYNSYKETDQIGGGIDPYSLSKASNELIFKNYLDYFIKNQKVGAASVRAGNVLGGGDWSEYRLIPDLVRSIQEKNTFKFREAKNIRPWQHVLDCLFGYIFLAIKLVSNPKKFSGCWNFGPLNSNITSEVLVKKFLKYLNYTNRVKIIKLKKNKFPEKKILKLDTNKAEKILKYKSLLNINETASFTAEWYKLFFQKKSNSEIINLTNLQIKNYIKNIKI
jgi:CDP-glucose 4,6-dehydratase